MNIDDFNELPEWNDHHFDEEEEEGEEWKPNATKALSKAMYAKWNEIIFLVKAAFDSLQEPAEDSAFTKEYTEDIKAMVLGDAYEVAAKIRSSQVDLYILRMENAAIVRQKAQFIKISFNNFIMEDLMEETHHQVLRSEIDAFRELFKQWVASFERDDCEDEWGLFV